MYCFFLNACLSKMQLRVDTLLLRGLMALEYKESSSLTGTSPPQSPLPRKLCTRQACYVIGKYFQLQPASPALRVFFRRRKEGEPAGNAGDVAFKVALDRLLLTPIYLAITLVSLRLLQGFSGKRTIRETRALYRGALLTNWKVRHAKTLVAGVWFWLPSASSLFLLPWRFGGAFVALVCWC